MGDCRRVCKERVYTNCTIIKIRKTLSVYSKKFGKTLLVPYKLALNSSVFCRNENHSNFNDKNRIPIMNNGKSHPHFGLRQ